MTVTANSLLLALKYDEAEEETIEMFLDGAIAFLENAGMYHPNNRLTDVVITQMVGFWMEHREVTYKDYKTVGDFPIGMQALLNQLKYLPVGDVNA